MHSNRLCLRSLQILSLAILVSLFFLFNSCSKDNPISSTEVDCLLPLELGNLWVYSEVNYDEFGEVADSIMFSETVAMAEIVDGVIWYKLRRVDNYFTGHLN